VAGIATIAAVAALVAFFFTRGSGLTPPSSPVSYVGPNDVARLDPATGKVVSVGGGGLKPGPLAVVGNMLWIGTRGSSQIGLADLRAPRGTPPFSVGPGLSDIAADAAGNVWVSHRKPVVTWIGDVTFGTSLDAKPVVSHKDVRVDLPGAGAEAVGAGFLWVISDLPGRTGEAVSLVDVRHRRLASTIPLGLQTTAIAYGYRSAWIGAYDPHHSSASLIKVRPGSAPVESLEIESQDGAGPLAVAVGEGNVWVVTSRGNLLAVDPRTLQIVHRIPMSAELPTLLAVGAGSVWTANHVNYSVSQIDPHTNKIVRTVPLGRYDAIPCGIETTHDAVFVATGESSCG